jgi:hypothetical protein
MHPSFTESWAFTNKSGRGWSRSGIHGKSKNWLSEFGSGLSSGDSKRSREGISSFIGTGQVNVEEGTFSNSGTLETEITFFGVLIEFDGLGLSGSIETDTFRFKGIGSLNLDESVKSNSDVRHRIGRSHNLDWNGRSTKRAFDGSTGRHRDNTFTRTNSDFKGRKSSISFSVRTFSNSPVGKESSLLNGGFSTEESTRGSLSLDSSHSGSKRNDRSSNGEGNLFSTNESTTSKRRLDADSSGELSLVNINKGGREFKEI